MKRHPAPTTGPIGVTPTTGTALSRLVAEANADADRTVTSPLERRDAIKVVLAIYREVYGTQPHNLSKHVNHFTDVEEYCFTEGIDFALYVEAQINSYRFSSGDGNFPLSWISKSAAALGRYEQYLKASFKKFRHQGRNILSASYTVAKIRRDIYADEFEAGRALCLIGDSRLTLLDVHSGCDEWQRCVQGNARTIQAIGGADHADRLYRVCRLAAARDVVNFYSHGLADYTFIAGEFAWAHLVEYLKMAFPPKPKIMIPEMFMQPPGRWSAARIA